ncbi:MAG: dTDP-glucose 4,6-dehydratase, partial [Deltaproteobacteria bacterium]|nr:dTDP-glucose 4,6-dehydratase [Deltaproteobacteria bacterium]
MSILVTGGAGFIGTNFILYWLAGGGVKIINLDKLTYAGNSANLSHLPSDKYQLIEGDIGDQDLVERLLHSYRPSKIINFAAESHVDRSINSPNEFIQTNVLGTFRLLEAVRAYLSASPKSELETFRFLHVSTDEVFGALGPNEAPFSETTPYAPNSPYSASKASSDHFVRAYYHTYGLPVLTTNCSNNYGPYQYPEKLIPLMILNGLTGKPLPVYGDGQQVRDWLHVEDHVRALTLVLKDGKIGSTYNIGGRAEKANMEVVQTICDLLDELAPDAKIGPRRSLITHVTDRLGHDRRYAINPS